MKKILLLCLGFCLLSCGADNKAISIIKEGYFAKYQNAMNIQSGIDRILDRVKWNTAEPNDPEYKDYAFVNIEGYYKKSDTKVFMQFLVNKNTELFVFNRLEVDNEPVVDEELIDMFEFRLCGEY